MLLLGIKAAFGLHNKKIATRMLLMFKPLITPAMSNASF